jgi:transposase
MGRRERGQGQFFYAFDLDKVVPADHLVRQVDGVLDFDWVHKELAPYYSHTGRPSIDPVLMIRMLIAGYVFAIRSERRLCSEVQVNLAYRWFCKLGIEDGIPDHSVFSRARHERFRQSDALRRVFEGVVAKCIAAGLVGGEGFSIDASLIRADVDKKKRTPGDQPISWPKAEEASRAVREYLTTLDAAQNRAENSEDDDKFDGGSRRKPPKEVSLTDPQAAWVARKNTDPFFAYDANYLIDNKAGIIVDAEGTRANRIVEIAITRTMLDRVGRRFQLRPQRLAADTAYGVVRLLKWLVDRKIAPHIPVWDKSVRSDGTLGRADFVFDRERNLYICPGGKLLHTTGTVIDGHTLRYVPRSTTAIPVLLNCGVVPTRPCGRFPVMFMRTPATSPAHWPTPRPTNNHAGSAKRWRCGSRT